MLSIIRTSVSHTQGGSSILLPKKYTSSEIFRSIGYLTLRKPSKKNKISGVWNEFQAILIHFRSIYSIFFGWVSPKKKISKIVNTFCHRGGSSDPVPNQGGVRLIKKIFNECSWGEGTIYLSFTTAFFCFLPKNVHCRMSDSPNLNCIFSGGGGSGRK